MTPEQALALLDQITQSVQATRQVHVQIQEALRVLKEATKK